MWCVGVGVRVCEPAWCLVLVCVCGSVGLRVRYVCVRVCGVCVCVYVECGCVRLYGGYGACM